MHVRRTAVTDTYVCNMMDMESPVTPVVTGLYCMYESCVGKGNLYKNKFYAASNNKLWQCGKYGKIVLELWQHLILIR